jgi:uncharacterized protein YhbP (UPF0306 family)
MDQSQIKQFITTNLPRIKHVTLGTLDDEGKPWVVVVGLSYDNKFNVIWQSRKDTMHSQYIAKRPEVGICIFGNLPEVGNVGFYAKAKAREVTDEQELAEKLEVRFSQIGKPVPSPADFVGDSPMRIYYAEIDEAWINSADFVKRAVDLDVLRAA